VPRFEDLPLLDLPPVGARYRTHHEQRRMLRRCLRDGIPLGQHAACCDCGALAGPEHPLAHALVGGRCTGCQG
jgi:hypothetical protein